MASDGISTRLQKEVGSMQQQISKIPEKIAQLETKMENRLQDFRTELRSDLQALFRQYFGPPPAGSSSNISQDKEEGDILLRLAIWSAPSSMVMIFGDGGPIWNSILKRKAYLKGVSLQDRFGCGPFGDPMRELINLKQHGSIFSLKSNNVGVVAITLHYGALNMSIGATTTVSSRTRCLDTGQFMYQKGATLGTSLGNGQIENWADSGLADNS
ncbi:hypothetical protein Goklo_029068 [Gossypium klotzschianum]|uniref:Uncharacterized protein n=1 Tax=Gossypium klotzschianum TaxID=34286 RepID=A0A7J8WAM5_9ROSI|nr:hypothetical protein [Gossypium klotzschianum]